MWFGRWRDLMSESSSSEDTEPPPRYPRVQRRNGDVTPTFSSPPASPSMSFHSLGRSPFSPLRHQSSAYGFASSQSPQSDHHHHHDDLAHDPPSLIEDSRDVLIQRLNDLAAKLSAEGEVQGESVDSMHAKVDELEHVLLQSLESRTRRHKRNQSSLSTNFDPADLKSGQTRPPWLATHLSGMSISNSEIQGAEMQTEARNPPPDQHNHHHHPQQKDKKTADTRHANQILAEAQKLQEALEMVANNLKARQEEQEHIHDLLITRAERAAQRIIYLESRVNELENDRSDGEMEILNLQIQLKAIEVQCLSYVPKDADPDLLQSIETWKTEWSALKRRKARKKGEQLAVPSSPTPRGFQRQTSRSQAAG